MLIKPNGKPQDLYKSPNGYKSMMPKKIHFPQNPALEKNKVRVSYNEKLGIFQVMVYATHGDGKHAMEATIPVRMCQNAVDLKAKVQLSAGTCAEILAARFGDQLDPDVCYKYAGELFNEVGYALLDRMRLPR